MDVNADETAVRQLFQDLTAEQPPAPPWRYQSVRRRLSRHRKLRAATWSGVLAVVAGAAATAGAVIPAASSGAHGGRSVPGWALPWPDHRNGSVPQRVLDGAVEAWQHFRVIGRIGAQPPVVRRVIWYVGQTAAAGREVVVTFEVSTGKGRYLVAGSAPAAQVMHGQPGWASGTTPWMMFDAPAPVRRPGLAVGLNLPDPANNPGHLDDWIMVLAAPDVRTVDWEVSLSETTTGNTSVATGSISEATTKDGLVIADAGKVIGRVQLTGLIVGHRNLLRSSGTVSVPGNRPVHDGLDSGIPVLAKPARLSPPSTFRPILGVTGQGLGGGYERDRIVPRRPAVIVRCYGPEPLRIVLGPRNHGLIPCDNSQHEWLGLAGSRPAANLIIQTSYLTAWRIELGSAPARPTR